jgi:hypothetical protein
LNQFTYHRLLQSQPLLLNRLKRKLRKLPKWLLPL